MSKDPFKRRGVKKPRSNNRLLKGKRKNAAPGDNVLNNRKRTPGRKIAYETKKRKPFDITLHETIVDDNHQKVARTREVKIVPKARKVVTRFNQRG